MSISSFMAASIPEHAVNSLIPKRFPEVAMLWCVFFSAVKNLWGGGVFFLQFPVSPQPQFNAV